MGSKPGPVRRRVEYFRTAFMKGLSLVNTLVSSGLNFLWFVGAIGLVAAGTLGVTVLDWPLWVVVVAALLLIGMILFEGAFRVHEATLDRAAIAEKDVKTRRTGVDITGGSLSADGLRIANQDTAIKADGTRADIRETDIT